MGQIILDDAFDRESMFAEVLMLVTNAIRKQTCILLQGMSRLHDCNQQYYGNSNI